jgi:hypothetical protein
MVNKINNLKERKSPNDHYSKYISIKEYQLVGTFIQEKKKFQQDILNKLQIKCVSIFHLTFHK